MTSLGVPTAADSSPAVHRLLEESRPRASRPLEGREAWAQTGAAVGFLAVAGVLAALFGGGPVSAPMAAVLVVAYALASRIEIDEGTGYTVPTQVVFVPMLFELPIGLVPLFVAAGSLLGSLPDYVTGRTHRHRTVLAVGDAWHSVGPVLVLALAGATTPAWGDWPIYLAALAAQFAFDFATSTTRDWLALGVAPRLQARMLGWVYLLDSLLAPVGLLAAFATVQWPYAFALTLPLLAVMAVFARDRRSHIEQALELSHAYRGTALLLGDVVEADDAYTGAHSRDVVELSLLVADELELDDRDRWRVEFGSLLHDVGKIAIPGEIINKAGPLDEHERALINTHTIRGQQMLAGIGGVLADVGQVVRSSHERYDGMGYPDGLSGEAIPIASRIVACCDAFNAMTTDRPYRLALPLPEALGELRANAGTQFDPRVVDALAGVVERQYGLSPAPKLEWPFRWGSWPSADRLALAPGVERMDLDAGRQPLDVGLGAAS